MNLSTVRSINEAAQKAAMGRGGSVFCTDQSGIKHRIVRARTVQGQLQVHRLSDGRWIVPRRVWPE
jgi:hypothetical protein